jgi:glyoxylase I family protein
MIVKGVHHVAYRCRDARRTADFYTKALGLKFTMAMSEQRVPTTGADCPYMHVFFQMGDGSHVAFFDLADAQPMNLDPNTPPWVQHLALEVENAAALEDAVQRLRDYGVEVIGPIDHNIFQSVYFHDPDGHRVELTFRTETPQAMQQLYDVKDQMLEEWSRDRKVSTRAAWVHQDLDK